MKRRWTYKELRNTNCKEFILRILDERRKSIQPDSPLDRKCLKAKAWLNNQEMHYWLENMELVCPCGCGEIHEMEIVHTNLLEVLTTIQLAGAQAEIFGADSHHKSGWSNRQIGIDLDGESIYLSVEDESILDGLHEDRRLPFRT